MKIPFLPRLKVRVIRDACESPYLIRITLFTLFGWSLKLHTFLRGDEDRELHDHPWGFWTLVLAGEYWEEVPESAGDREKVMRGPDAPFLPIRNERGNVTIHRPTGSLGYRPPEWKHRVTIQNPCVTLVLTRGRVREWGFWTAKGWVEWFKFTSSREC